MKIKIKNLKLNDDKIKQCHFQKLKKIILQYIKIRKNIENNFNI